MSSRRLHRLVVAALAVLALLCAQVALGRYLCPGLAEGSMWAGQPCSGMDPDQPALCHQQGTQTGVVLELAQTPVLSAPALVQVWVIPPIPETAPRPWQALLQPPEAQAPPDPLFLATLRLRV